MQLPVNRSRVKNRIETRNITVQYFLNGKRICKKVFISVLCIGRGRLNYMRQKKCVVQAPTPDRKGRKQPKAVKEIRQFVDEVPKFRSHYSDSNIVYISPDLNYSKLYNMYLEKNPENKVSLRIFQREFKNVGVEFYTPSKDTCSKCDEFKTKQWNDISDGERTENSSEQERHLEKALFAQEMLKEKTEESKENPSLLCFSFDLQKTQRIPYLNASAAFYKRQMWLYSLGINLRNTNKGTMCIWQETEGRRGSNEVASSIDAFLKTLNLSKYEAIHSFSEGCDNQNRNETILGYFMYVINNTNIKTWTHTYLENGHSYLLNDTDFGKIEKIKNKNLHVFNYDEWVKIIRLCKFDVVDMKNRFFDFKKLQKNLNFKKLNNEGEKFTWQEIRWVQLRSNTPNLLHYKNSNDPNETPKVLDFSGKSKTKTKEPEKLYEEKIQLSLEKYNDILSLLKYVPPIHQDYFRNLPHQIKPNQNFEYFPDETEPI